LITHLQGSKGRVGQSMLDGGVFDDWIWSCHGVRSAEEVGCDSGVWVCSLSEEKFNSL